MNRTSVWSKSFDESFYGWGLVWFNELIYLARVAMDYESFDKSFSGKGLGKFLFFVIEKLTFCIE